MLKAQGAHIVGGKAGARVVRQGVDSVQKKMPVLQVTAWIVTHAAYTPG